MLLILAWLGVVLVGFVAQMFVPDTPLGRVLVFAAFFSALYPLARLLWFAKMPAWRYWVGLAVGAVVVWILEVSRMSWAPQTNSRVGLLVVAALTVPLLYDIWRRQPSRQSKSK
jgi:hypothetical protein